MSDVSLHQAYEHTIQNCNDFKVIHDNNKGNYQICLKEFERKAELLERARRSRNSVQRVEDLRHELKELHKSMITARNNVDEAFQQHQSMFEYIGPALVDSNYIIETSSGELFTPEDYEIPTIVEEIFKQAANQPGHESLIHSRAEAVEETQPTRPGSRWNTSIKTYQEMVAEFKKLQKEHAKLKNSAEYRFEKYIFESLFNRKTKQNRANQADFKEPAGIQRENIRVQQPSNSEEEPGVAGKNFFQCVKEALDERSKIRGIKAALDQLKETRTSLEHQWFQAASRMNEQKKAELEEKLMQIEKDMARLTIEFDYHVDEYCKLRSRAATLFDGDDVFGSHDIGDATELP